MSSFKHILVPSDLGETQDDIIDTAVSMARKFGAKVTLLHSFYLPPIAYADGCYVPIDEMMRDAKAAVDAGVAKIKESYSEVEGVLAQGEPSEVILRIAKESSVDLIVMGTRGRRGLPHLLLGSVAEKVVRLSPIPVLTVSTRPASEADTSEKTVGLDPARPAAVVAPPGEARNSGGP